MKLSANWLIGAHLLSLAACSGSGATTTSNPPEPAKPAATAATAAAATGWVGMLERALGEVNLRPEQKTEIDQMIRAAEARHAGVKEAGQGLKTAIADQLDSGSYDRAKLDREVGALEAALQKTSSADVAALARLHAVLDANQRNLLVDALEGELTDHKRDGKGRGRRGGMFKAKKWAVDLALSDDQKDQ